MKKITIGLFIIFTILVSSLKAEILYNGVSTTSETNDIFTLNYNHSGDDGLLLVMVGLKPTDECYKVYTVTYNGVTLSNGITAQTKQSIHTELWYKVNPPKGNYEVYVQLTASAQAIVNVVSLTGVNQVDPFYFKTTCSGTQVTSIPFTIQEKTGNSILGVGTSDSNSYSYLLPGQTELWKEVNGSNQISQAVFATSTQTGYLSVANYLNEVSDWSLILLNIEAKQ